MRRLAHLSDLHFGTEQPHVLDELADSLRGFAPQLVVVTGDITQRARTAEFLAARRFFDALALPLLLVPGNHDIAPLYRPLARLLSPYARYQRYIARELDHAHYDDELLVLGLSSVQPLRWKEGTIAPRQLSWIAEYAQRFPGHLRLLAAHHPLVEAETGQRTRRLRRHGQLARVLDAADIAVCLSGHLHRSFTGLAVTPLDEAGSVLAVHASTATSTRLRGHANAYNQLTLDGTRLWVEAMAFDGQAFRSLSSSGYERAAGIWHARGTRPLEASAALQSSPSRAPAPSAP